ncbi:MULTISPECIES: site-specific integrase [unclassified Breznakia]|uniref:tyrosine-type recombinase/integrase n=1 Tax=unclassified Breznakia TaxID=2623764 RepID=UPI002474C019|nr:MULTISPECIES: site-specific integrase [unclassified Breznakia]MDH6367125.1 integrase [Breznakia sp. PH1-1]MDH6404288.1 integrase [Breznakia sp. PF1-11]MDH6412012.1 integrase [Breznakia sp. PFB1-11]MDH6414276.1 integrase [Breznakia sp. PFB1-14]MDH6416626.1 integrase [Breznakia sp. PFB1-4]
MLYETLINEWHHAIVRDVKETTHARYFNMIENHIVPDLGQFEANDLTNTQIERYVDYKLESGNLVNQGGLSHSTVDDILTIVKSSLKYGVQQELVEKDISALNAKMPKGIAVKPIEIFSKRNFKRLIKYLISNPTSKNIAILISCVTGARIGEVCALQFKHFSFPMETAYIEKTYQRIYEKGKGSRLIMSEPKTKHSIRFIPIPTEVMKLIKRNFQSLETYIASGTDKPCEPNNLRSYYNRLLKRLRIKHLKYHCTRHTFATNSMEIGWDVKALSEVLGHADVAITLRLYDHPAPAYKRKMSNKTFNKILS